MTAHYTCAEGTSLIAYISKFIVSTDISCKALYDICEGLSLLEWTYTLDALIKSVAPSKVCQVLYFQNSYILSFVANMKEWSAREGKDGASLLAFCKVQSWYILQESSFMVLMCRFSLIQVWCFGLGMDSCVWYFCLNFITDFSALWLYKYSLLYPV